MKTIMTIVWGLLIAILGGAFSGYLTFGPDDEMGIVLRIALIALSGWFVGISLTMIVRKLRVWDRNKQIIGLLLLSMLSDYSSWVLWCFSTTGEASFSLTSILHKASLFSEQGWILNDNIAVYGPVFWVFWMIELVLIFGVSFYVWNARITRVKICKHCGYETKRNRVLKRDAISDLYHFASSIEKGDLLALFNLGQPLKDSPYTKIIIRQCDYCKHSYYLSIYSHDASTYPVIEDCDISEADYGSLLNAS